MIKTTYGNIVLHIPHNSTDGIEQSGWPKSADFERLVNRWTDWHTLPLFCNNKRKNIKAIVFDKSRFVVDVERLIDDPLEEIGQGIVYRNYDGFVRSVSDDEVSDLMNCYMAHHDALKSTLTEDCLLIDCHSFPSDLSDVDVCIGYNDDWSKPSQDVIDHIVTRFREAGYKVGVNEPYSNSVSPQCDFTYHSVMIELNKRIYLNEDTLKRSQGARRVRRVLLDLYDELLAWNGIEELPPNSNIMVNIFDRLCTNKSGKRSLKNIMRKISARRLMPISQEYAEALAVDDKERCREIKKTKVSAFAVAAHFEGGKAMKNVKGLTGLGMVDIDHLENDVVDDLFRKACDDDHTLMAYRSLSGLGFHVIFRYEFTEERRKKTPMKTPKSMNLAYGMAHRRAGKYYEKLLGVEVDQNGCSVTQLSLLNYDPNVYLKDVEPETFVID